MNKMTNYFRSNVLLFMLVVFFLIVLGFKCWLKIEDELVADDDVFAGSTFPTPYQVGITLIPTIVSKNNKTRYYGVQNTQTKQWTWQRRSPYM